MSSENSNFIANKCSRKVVLFAVGILVVGLTKMSGSSAEEKQAESTDFLWAAPETGSFILAPGMGYSTGSEFDGVTAALNGLFFFKYFIGAITANAIFSDSGTVYRFGVDVCGRYGPIFAGVGFSGHWLPGKTDTSTSGGIFKTGIHVPAFFHDMFFDVTYGLSVVNLRSNNVLYHTITLDLLFELDDNDEE
jgi:hypothetical protein